MSHVTEFLASRKKAVNLYNRFCAPVCRKFGVNQTGFDILLFLANHPNCSTAREISSLRGLKSGLVSVGVETLIQQGYLERGAYPGDRRVKRLLLTPASEPLIEAGRAAQQAFWTAVTDGLSEEEWAIYWQVCQKLMKNIDKLEKEAEPYGKTAAPDAQA